MFFFAGNADPSLYYNEYYEASNGGHSAAQYTWLIALLGSLAFMLILVSFVMIYYRKKPKHYLAANTSGKVNLMSFRFVCLIWEKMEKRLAQFF